MKTCKRCLMNLPSSKFYVRKWRTRSGSLREGIDSYCKKCRLEEHKTSWVKKRNAGDPWLVAGDLLNRMRDRTSKKGYVEDVEWSKDEIYLRILNGKCEATGLPFRLELSGVKGARNALGPSPDRLDNTKGYTKDNVQWVVFIYNAMKNNFPQVDVDTFIKALRETGRLTEGVSIDEESF